MIPPVDGKETGSIWTHAPLSLWEKTSRLVHSVFGSHVSSQPVPQKSTLCNRCIEQASDTAKTPFADRPVNPYPICSDEDRFYVKELVTTFHDANLLSLGVKMFRLAEIGDRIARLHPLTFIQVVCSDRELKAKLKRCFDSPLKRLGMMNGTVFREGFIQQLDREQKRGTLEKNIKAFSMALKVDETKIRPFFQEAAWTDLFYYLFEKTPSQEGRSFRA